MGETKDHRTRKRIQYKYISTCARKGDSLEIFFSSFFLIESCEENPILRKEEQRCELKEKKSRGASTVVKVEAEERQEES